MGAELDMDVDDTSYQMKALAAIGEDLAEACRTARTEIDWLSATLGGGPMGARFKNQYEPARTELEQRIDTDQQRTLDLAGAGGHCVDVYATADAHAEAELLRVRFK
jgi:hypothetical protein